MHKLIAELEQLTLHLVGRIDEANAAELTRFVEQREALTKAMLKLAGTEKITDQDRMQLEQIFKYDELIIDKMNLIKIYAASKLSKVATGRTHRSGYNVEHKPGGIFIDKKK